MTTTIFNSPFIAQDYTAAKESNASTDIISIYSEPVNDFVNATVSLAEQINTPEYKSCGGRKIRVIGDVLVRKYNVIAKFSDEEKKNTSKIKRVFLSFLNAAGMIFGGFVWIKLRQMFEVRRQSSIEIQRIDKVLDRIKTWKTETTDKKELMALEKHEVIARARKNIFTRMRRKTSIDVCLIVSTIAAASFALLTGILSVTVFPPLSGLASLSVVFTVSFAAAFLIKWIFDKPDKGHSADAKDIINAKAYLDDFKV